MTRIGEKQESVKSVASAESVVQTDMEETMSEENAKSCSGNCKPASAGAIWFIGWLFTIGFVKLIWWKALLAIVLWPWFLGAALR